MSDVHTPRPVSGSFGYLGSPGKPDDRAAMVWVVEGAEAAPSVEPGAWIRERLQSFGAGCGTPVGAVVPTGYEAYARLLHPARRDSMGEVPVRWSEVAAWSGRSIHPEVQWEALARPLNSTLGPQPWYYEPDVGLCPQDIRKPLVEILRQFSAQDYCWVAVWEGWGSLGGGFPEVPLLGLPHRKHLLLSASWEVLESSIFGGSAEQRVGPSLWWPPDRSWCVATEIDFRWTYVGGSRECIDRILSDDRLEALPAAVEHRGDYLSDTINGAVSPF